MVLGFSRGSDATAGFDKVPGGLRDMDLKKQMKNPKQHDAPEAIIEGATADSIAEFVTKSQQRRTVQATPGLWAQIKSLFGR